MGKIWANTLSYFSNTLKTKVKTKSAHYLDIVKVAGSSPITPTIKKPTNKGLFLFLREKSKSQKMPQNTPKNTHFHKKVGQILGKVLDPVLLFRVHEQNS